MQPSKPSTYVAVLFLFLAFSFLQFSPQNNQTEQPAKRSTTDPIPTPQALPAQTGRGEAMEAIVPIERIRRQAFERRAPAKQQEPDQQAAPEELEYSPDLLDFIDEVSDGNAEVIRGVHVPGVLTLPVVQQPQKNPAYVSEENETVTQFQSAAQYGITGLLAHNYLAGELFYNIDVGHDVIIVMGDGEMRQYRVSGIYRYKKLSPNNLRSSLVDLSDGKTLTTSQVFSQFYRGDHKVTFQTCLEGEGKLNWGLTFFVAEPVENQIR